MKNLKRNMLAALAVTGTAIGITILSVLGTTNLLGLIALPITGGSP